MPTQTTRVYIPLFASIQKDLETYLIPFADQIGKSGHNWQVSITDLGNPEYGRWTAYMYPCEGKSVEVSGWLDPTLPATITICVTGKGEDRFYTERPDRSPLPSWALEEVKRILEDG